MNSSIVNRAAVLCAVLLTGVALGGSAAAQEPEPDAASRAFLARSVGDHSYARFDSVAWPFVATRVASRTRFGVDQFSLDGLPPDRDVAFDGEFVEMSQQFDLHLRILDWLGIQIEAAAGAIAGADSVGALFVGANGYGGLRVSGIARLIETDMILISARLDLGGYGVLGVAPARAVAAFTDDGAIPVARIRPDVDGNVGSVGGSLAGAVTANEWLGFMWSATVDGRRIEIEGTDETEGNIAGAVGVSFNFGPLGVPLQLLTGLKVNWNFGDDFSDVALAALDAVDDLRVEPELGFYYADPDLPELELGVTTTFVFTGVSERARLGFNLGYWW